MTRKDALRKYLTLLKMTTNNGCTKHEAATAHKLAENLNNIFHFQDDLFKNYQSEQHFDETFQHEEQQAAQKYRWEYRKCGKKNCHCYQDKGHGPYKYQKIRKGKTVRSVYMGR